MDKDAIELMKSTKMNKHLATIDSKVRFESSISNFCVPSHRKNRRFESIDEYKEFIGENRWTVKDFVRNGYSKSQVAFFNFVLKGKLSITKDQFVLEYCHKFVELSDIADEYGVPRDYMVFLREFFGVKRIGATGLARGRETIPLSGHQKSIVFGTMMGDCSIDKGGSYRIKHGRSQADYASHKVEAMADHFSSGVKEYKSYDDRFDTVNTSFSAFSMCHGELKGFRNLFYDDDGIKTITTEILDSIDDIALAYWYMDDGSTNFIFSDSGEAVGCECRVFTCSFSYEENNMISGWFSETYGIKPSIRFKLPSECKNPYLSFCGKDAFTLIDIINPHVIESMKYKSDPQEFLIRRRQAVIDSCPLTYEGKDKFTRLPESEQGTIVDEVFNYYREIGFPFIRLTDEAINTSVKRISSWGAYHLVNDDNTIKINTNSTNIIWHFQPHIFGMSTRNSLTPMEIFVDDEKFRDAIYRRLKYGGPCTPSGIRSVLKEYRSNRSVGNFLPSVAKAVMYLVGASEKSRVLDFCAGFGGRLLGCCGYGVGKYVGIDPLVNNCVGLKKMAAVFPGDTDVEIINGTAEDELPRINCEFDYVFTSPPYFDKEIYSSDSNQSYLKYPRYSDWLHGWLLSVCKMASSKMCAGGRFILSVGKSDGHDVASDFLSSCSFLTVDYEIKVDTPVISYNRKRGAKRHQSIFVMRKS